MNMDQTQDRLGANGLVNKGVYQSGKGPNSNATQSINAFRTTVASMANSTPWMHNDLGKKHSYYTRSPQEEWQMAQTMGSSKWGTSGAGRTMMSPAPGGSQHKNLVDDDGTKKAYLIKSIKRF